MEWVLFLNRSLCHKRARKIAEFRGMIVATLGCDDVNVITPGSRHLAGLLERGLGGLAAVNEFTMFAHCFDREAHFFFFFFFFSTSAWLLKACAKARI
jgi:hypothetical protein